MKTYDDVAVPPIVDEPTWETAVAELRVREKAATHELDAIAAARRRLPMVELPDNTLEGAEGPVRLVDVFGGMRQLVVYDHMWFPGETWQCPGVSSGGVVAVRQVEELATELIEVPRGAASDQRREPDEPNLHEVSVATLRRRRPVSAASARDFWHGRRRSVPGCRLGGMTCATTTRRCSSPRA